MSLAILLAAAAGAAAQPAPLYGRPTVGVTPAPGPPTKTRELVTEAPAAAARWPVPDVAGARAMMDRLVGQRAGWHDGFLAIDAVAGAGRPWVGVVERRGDALWLRGDGFALRLTGPLARPRLAGPGYLLWVAGSRAGEAIAVWRLGVLAAPPRAR